MLLLREPTKRRYKLILKLFHTGSRSREPCCHLGDHRLGNVKLRNESRQTEMEVMVGGAGTAHRAPARVDLSKKQCRQLFRMTQHGIMSGVELMPRRLERLGRPALMGFGRIDAMVTVNH